MLLKKIFKRIFVKNDTLINERTINEDCDIISKGLKYKDSKRPPHLFYKIKNRILSNNYLYPENIVKLAKKIKNKDIDYAVVEYYRQKLE